MKKPKRIPVTGGAGRWPVYDRHGKQINFGDRLRAQVCTGRYGQTSIIEVFVTDAHWPYCFMPVGDNLIRTEYANEKLTCYYKHVDYEHGHEAWAEIIEEGA